MADLTARLLEIAQKGLPLTPRPFLALAEELGVSEEEVIDTLAALERDGVIRELSVFLDPRKLGYTSTLACMTVPEEQIVDPTGVGDAFRGGFLTGYAHGFDWKLCGEIGSLAAVYCLEQKGTQTHTYTRPEFVARFRQHFDDGGKLNKLLNTKEKP